MSNATLTDAQARMKKAVDHTLHEFSTIHTGKASPAMVESVMVEAYGSMMPLKGCAAITTPDPRMIQIQPWDKGVLRAIEKALQMANIGVNPVVDGTLIRLPFPELSRERRQEFVKTAQRLAEEGRVAVRHVRRDAMEATKKLKKDGKISEDDEKRLEKDVQAATDKAIKDIDGHLANKEKDLLTV
ncbi:Ribosome-recycling factor [Lacunisphaera limnophila]|uniref:Ribosome-recycling factor n=1 Tax=Lacunisphaera limnophila TaxID=1838286 RepID=A0A1D8AV60_9BACT|nr:ribosome recycling factor [Lacunisphaera limnophila]AOS44726.1 Ribosome-recycling factor [Lacunisphaera limnophila]